MSDPTDSDTEAMLDAILFAHEIAFAPEHEHASLTDSAQAREFEHAAALAAAAFAGSAQTPKALANRLAAAGLQFCAERQRQAGRESSPPAGLARLDGQLDRQLDRQQSARAASPRRTGMLLGFLAGIAATVLIWFVASKPAAAPDLAAARQQLLAKHEVQRLEWKVGPSPLSGTVHGDVVWSPTAQAGYLTFEGLPPLGPEQRFQLWIVDGARKDSAPVDGGVFAITDAQLRTIVPIQAKLPIAKAAAFVITVEDKAGVVVSKQEHVVAIAGL